MVHFGEGRRRVLRRAEEVIRGEEEIGALGGGGKLPDVGCELGVDGQAAVVLLRVIVVQGDGPADRTVVRHTRNGELKFFFCSSGDVSCLRFNACSTDAAGC